MACLRSCFSCCTSAESPNNEASSHRTDYPNRIAGATTTGRTGLIDPKTDRITDEEFLGAPPSEFRIVVEDSLSDPLPPTCRWIVALDFGTTYSGYAYANAIDKKREISVIYDWPSKHYGKPYCKTVTGLLYKYMDGELKCSTWGHHAKENSLQKSGDRGASIREYYLSRFKLLLNKDSSISDLNLPPSLSVNDVVTEFLRQIGGHAIEKLKSHDGETLFDPDSLQWCVTVPSIWDDYAKYQMRLCMVKAGLVSEAAGGADAVRVVLEPEAASFLCHEVLRSEFVDVSLYRNDKILVVDVGGGTVDIVMQELIGVGDDYRVRELTESSGGLCGGTHVDNGFLLHLYERIPCLEEFLCSEYPSYKHRLLNEWEVIKCTFGKEESEDVKMIDLHLKLAQKWQAYEKKLGREVNTETIVLNKQDLMSIFDPVVERILDLIAAQLNKGHRIKAMFMVGGFAESPYLQSRIQARFSKSVQYIRVPTSPGSAIMRGAVSLAFNPKVMEARVARKTYGTSVALDFQPSDRHDLRVQSHGRDYCVQKFDKLVTKGQQVEGNMTFHKSYRPISSTDREILFDLYCSDEKDPKYVDGPSVTKLAEMRVELPPFDITNPPSCKFSISFGGSTINMMSELKTAGQGPISASHSIHYFS